MGSIRFQSSILEIIYLFIRKHRFIIICLFNGATIASLTIASLTRQLQAIILHKNPAKAALNRPTYSRLPEATARDLRLYTPAIESFS